MIILLVEKVDIQRIKALLESVPGRMEIDSINLKNGYSLNLVAGEDALNQLNDILGFYKSLDSGNKLLQK